MWVAEVKGCGEDCCVVFTNPNGYEYGSHLMNEHAARSIAAQFNGERMTEWIAIEDVLERTLVDETSSVYEVKLSYDGWMWLRDCYDVLRPLVVVNGQVEVYERG